ncbi:50S ribosomal protein L25/general stress protein Ctc [Acetobacter persici]|uniref:Large ribosomal subunit protein bL25 n=2 Tax=Acetobacter persici TaxID=1076596 RepID=A0A1U9LHX9_9PROT|nr:MULTISPECIES: 50S ribosomal protein L25/general stress protein Ctc [Acetobacter]AQT06012.1 50S ribosomal protein L25/general stress protein Ctc [Acetobacter persici]MBS0963400.1 50S ribosomal protein L25/general stress protein Ctc [Acetobacter persici]MBS1001651.1 50S ribosomal protein L25/general stress protein Ctc [Acetobacter persici]MBS1016273.1 50S ribosomal protein L25/general stress protein Ctc [Acetobacter persici]MCG0997032.1 50S ribosomal protein L25/general stress protein Ctc [Ac
MSKITSIDASARAKAGKGAARATRRAGLVPAVIYGGKKEPTLIALDPRIVIKGIQASGWRSRVYEIKVEGGVTERALIRDIQLHPVKDSPEHVDFLRLAAGQKVTVEVSVHFSGEEKAPGIKRGGVLNIVRHTVEVEADAEHIPEFFTVDLSALDINDNVRWEDLKGTENVTPLVHIPNFVIATIAAPSVDEADEAAEAEAPSA